MDGRGVIVGGYGGGVLKTLELRSYTYRLLNPGSMFFLFVFDFLFFLTCVYQVKSDARILNVIVHSSDYHLRRCFLYNHTVFWERSIPWSTWKVLNKYLSRYHGYLGRVGTKRHYPLTST